MPKAGPLIDKRNTFHWPSSVHNTRPAHWEEQDAPYEG